MKVAGLLIGGAIIIVVGVACLIFTYLIRGCNAWHE